MSKNQALDEGPIPHAAQEQALILAASIKAQADQRIGQAVQNISTMILVEMFNAGYASALRDNDLIPAEIIEGEDA